MASGRVTLTSIADIIQEVYKGALAKALLEYSDAYAYLQKAGKIRTWEGATYEWPVVKSGSGDASNIQDGGTLPDATQETYDKASLNYSIFIKMIRVGRLANIASTNKQQFYIQAKDLLQHQVQRALPQMARTIHSQIVGEADTTYGINGIGTSIGAMTNTYAGIDRTAATYWVPYVNHNSGTNRTLTEALMLDVYDTLTEDRDSEPDAIWAGVTAWNALAKLLGTSGATANYYINQDPANMAGGAITLYWKGIPVTRMRGMDTNHMYFLNFEEGSEGTGIELLKQHNDDFVVTPEATNAYDNRLSIAGHYMMVCHNPWKQGALKDVQ
jgi:hypothetical protein